MSAPVDMLPADAARYLDELAAEIVARGNPAGDLQAEIKAAHERRQKFAAELLVCETRRTRLAKRVLSTSVFFQVNVRNEMVSLKEMSHV